MLDPRKYTIIDIENNHQLLINFLKRSFPRSAEDFWKLEQELSQTMNQVGDQILMTHLIRAHQDKDFIKIAIERAQEKSDLPLVNKGWGFTGVQLPGGTKITLKTPYLKSKPEVKRGKSGKKRSKKSKGIYPVLEQLGIFDGVTPATRSEISLLMVQSSGYQEAFELLKRRGIDLDISTLVRITTSTAQADLTLRDAALNTAMSIPVPLNGPLAGKRVRISLDGGRVRTRKNHKGRKTKKGRHKFSTPWREPRVLVIDILDEEGRKDPLKLPLYDVKIGDADATFSLLIGYLRLLGAAQAQVVEFIADGADWIWDRIDRLTSEAEIPESKLVQAIDFYHASEHLAEAIELCRNIPAKQRKKIYKKLRHILRHDPWGVKEVMEKLRELAKTRRGKKMKKALHYFEVHAHRMNYYALDQKKLSVGSGQVESAVRRIINLRFKSCGSFWNEQRVDNFMHLRAFFKSGHWDELMLRVLKREFFLPSFEPDEKPFKNVNLMINCPGNPEKNREKEAA
jgi:hypothetical protein